MNPIQRINCACAAEEVPELQIPNDLQALLLHIRGFWKNGAVGWAPIEASQSLQRIDFDNLVDLAHEFTRWYSAENQSRGQLILAWVALGAVAEGCLQWFLSVYTKDYLKDPLFRRSKTGTLIPPEDIFFYKLIRYIDCHIWAETPDTPGPARKQVFSELLHTIRLSRNVIHPRKSTLRSWDEWKSCLHGFLILLSELEGRVPYPDECFSYPYDAYGALGRHMLVVEQPTLLELQ